jgi:hypothetical protein
MKDALSNCTVVGAPAYIIKKDGVSVKKKGLQIGEMIF